MQPNNFTFKWTRHASQRASERDIPIPHVEFVIRHSVDTVHDPKRNNYKSYAMVEHPTSRLKEFLLVVHTSKFNTEVSIISVMWTTKGELRKNGFSIS